MASHLPDEPGVRELRAGSEVRLTSDHFTDAYDTLRVPDAGGPVRLLDTRICPGRADGPLTGGGVYRDGRFRSVRGVPLTARLLSGAPFLAYGVEMRTRATRGSRSWG